MPKYPDVKVQLSGEDGNAFAIMGRVLQAMRGAGLPEEVRAEFTKQATSGDYDNLLCVCMEWVDVDGQPDDEDLDDNWDEEEED